MIDLSRDLSSSSASSSASSHSLSPSSSMNDDIGSIHIPDPKPPDANTFDNNNIISDNSTSRPLHIFTSDNNTIIECINPSVFESSNFSSIPIQSLFPKLSKWISHKNLYDDIKLYGSKMAFTVASNAHGKIYCSRSSNKSNSQSSKSNSRNFINGHLKIGCKFGLQLTAVKQKEPKPNVKKPRRRPDYYNGPVIIKDFNYEHTNGCNPCSQQFEFVCSRTGKYISKIPIQVYWQLCSHIKRSPKRHVSSSTIRSALAGSFPDSVNITKQDIFNTCIRCKRLMKTFNNSKEFQSFEETLNCDSVFLKNIESDFELEKDEATEMIHQLFDSMFNNSDDDESVCNDADESSDIWKFHDYLELISNNAKGFQYRLAIGSDNQINGAVWMTASMRSNMERFGSYLCLDTMKRELNTLKWPYFAVALNNELGHVCVGCEGLMIEERTEAYSFLLDSCFQMCPNRKKDDVYIISGDGFFNQRLINNWGFNNARFIADYWHLFDSGLKDRFGNQNYFKILENNLRNMANAYSEERFNSAYNDCKLQLQSLGSRNGIAEMGLEKFYQERETYALYLIKQIPGNRDRRGSVAAEQNHASVISLCYGDKESKHYMEHAHVMIRDLITRQKNHINKTNKALYGLTNNSIIDMQKIEENKNSVNYQLLKDAVTGLNHNAFTSFKKELSLSEHYTTTIESDLTHGQYQVVKHNHAHNSIRKFYNNKDRCNCDYRLTHLAMCRHEICKDRKFDINKFDIQHHYRESSTKSYAIGPEIQYNNKSSCTIVSQILDTINNEGSDDEDAPMSDIDLADQNLDQHNIIDNNEIMEENYIYNNSNMSKSTQSTCKFLHPKSIQNINNDILSNYHGATDQCKQSMSALLIMIRDCLQSNCRNKTVDLSTNQNILQNQLKDIVLKYNMSFVGKNVSFDTSNQSIPSAEQLRARSVNRKKPMKELHQKKKARTKPKVLPKCTYCGEVKHKITTCPKRLAYETKYKVVDNDHRNDFLNYLRNNVPVLDPVSKVICHGFIKQTHHTIVHEEIYAKNKDINGLYSYLQMSEMFFTVSLIAIDTGNIEHDKIVIPGGDLESYIHNTKTIKNRFLYDGTNANSMRPEGYHYRTSSYSQSNYSHMSYEQEKKDPPEDFFELQM